jgi:hypothetical protein
VNILPRDIGDLYPRRITIRLAIDAGCDVDRLIDVGELDIPESHVFDMTAAGVRLDPSCITAVREVDVLEYHVVDLIWLGRVLADTPDAHSS